MPARLKAAAARGARQFLEHPQLWYTVLVAIAIVASFLYISSRFIGIAKNAQDELTNVRIGAIQDAFAPLAHELFQEPQTLRGHMKNIRALNPTITDFLIVREEGAGWRVMVSADPQYESSDFLGSNFLLNLAKSDPRRSYTVQESEGSDRFFRTARAIVDENSSVVGIVVTRQTLSEADRKIASSISVSIATLILILLALLLLFFKHARIIDYAALYRKLKEIDHLKDDFISMASHELRTPLTAIRGYVDMLKTGDSLSSAERIQSLERIDASARSLDNLIADMLDVSRIEQGRMTFTLTNIDPNVIIREVCDLLQPVAKAKGLSIVPELADNAKIGADKDRFRQITLNLVGNAVKYTHRGPVSVKTSLNDSTWTMRVSDTGIGMPNSVREHLFEKFYRAPGEAVRAQRGTGLGLWITKQLIERMNGRIEVESIENIGSHFIVSFPAAK